MESVWTEDIKIRERKPLSGDLEIPAVIIGAGLAGILTGTALDLTGIGICLTGRHRQTAENRNKAGESV